jgi:flagellar basal-body rod modification protein FlgD
MSPTTGSTTPTQNNSSSGNSNSSGSSTASSSSTDVTKNEFLQLLVAQLQNQDPLSPADGTQFLTQLAQFQQLEQSMNTGQDVSSILTAVDQLAGISSSTTSSTTSGTSQG